MRRVQTLITGILAVLLLLCVIGCSTDQSATQFRSEHFIAQISQPEQEAAYVWALIKESGYFRERGYSVSLPRHGFVEELVGRERQGTLREEDYAELVELFKGEIYEAKAYERAYREVGRALSRIETVYGVFLDYDAKWGFKVWDQYEIRLTLYGPGGMFDPERGIIWIMITDAGSFKMNSDPAYVVIHEATHIGVDGLFRRYSLPQPVMERVVDKFVVDHFSEILPKYRMQEWADTAIDPYLGHPDSWDRLPEYIGRYAEELSKGDSNLQSQLGGKQGDPVSGKSELDVLQYMWQQPNLSLQPICSACFAQWLSFRETARVSPTRLVLAFKSRTSLSFACGAEIENPQL